MRLNGILCDSLVDDKVVQLGSHSTDLCILWHVVIQVTTEDTPFGCQTTKGAFNHDTHLRQEEVVSALHLRDTPVKWNQQFVGENIRIVTDNEEPTTPEALQPLV